MTPESSEAGLAELLGRGNVSAIGVPLGEGATEPGTALFPNDPARMLHVLWRDPNARRLPRVVQVRGDRWHTKDGIRLGTTLKELEEINGGPFTLTGFEYDNSGTVISWEAGKLAKAFASRGRLLLR